MPWRRPSAASGAGRRLPGAWKARRGAVGASLLVLGILGGLLAALPGAPGTRAQAQPPAPPSSASCETCHAGIESIHETVDLTCTECHGGDGSQREKNRAHVQPRNRELWTSSANPRAAYGALNLESPEFIRFVNPADLRVADVTCGGKCHGPIVDAVRRSIMATNPMVYHAGLYNNGVEPSKIPVYGEAFAPIERDGRIVYAPARIRSLGELTPRDLANGVLRELAPLPRWEVTIPTDPFRVLERGNVGASPRARGTEFKVSGVFLTLLKTRLNDPGLWLLGPNDIGGDYRQSGCAACHMPYANDREPANAAHLAQYGNRGFSHSGDRAIPKNEAGHPIKHQFTRSIPSSQCMSCHHHQGNGALNMFQGYLMWDQESDADRVVGLGMGYAWWDPDRKVLGVDPPYRHRLGPHGTPRMADIYDHNAEMRHVQFGDAHGHGWHFVRVYKRDRYGRLLDAGGQIVPDADPERFRKAVHLKDIHLEKGMQCIDCHGVGDIHGDGKLYSQMRDVIEIRCQDCHGTPARRATLVTSGPRAGRDLTRELTPFGKRWLQREGDRIVQHSKITEGLSWEVRQVRDAVDPGHPRFNPLAARAMALRKDGSFGPVTSEAELAHNPQAAMECVACHASWNSGCWGCHLSVRTNVKTREVHIAGEPTRVYPDYFPQLLRTDHVMLGIGPSRQSHKISPFRPANPVSVSVTDRGRNIVVHEQPTISSPGFSGFSFTPNIPHSTRVKEARDCEDCHVSKANDNNAWLAAVLGFGTNAANAVGDYAYVATGSAGVLGIRVAEGYEPKPVIGSWLHSVAYPQDYQRFVGGGRRLPEAHRADSTAARAIVRRGEFLFIADGPGGLRVYDIAQIANKSAAQRIVSAPFSPFGNWLRLRTMDATAVALAANNPMDLDRTSRPENEEQPVAPIFRYAFVTDRVEGLIVTDINTFSDGNPLNNHLTRAATYNPGGILTGADNITIAGNYAYVATKTGLTVLNVAMPTSPRFVATIGPPALVEPRAVQVQFRYAFVVDRDGLKVVDVTDPERPRATPARVPIRDARDLYLLRSYAYVAAGAQGLAIVDVERPEAPGAPTFFDAGGQINDATGITIGATYAGQYAYVADGKNGLRVVKLIDTATPGHLGWAPAPTPELVASYPTPGPALRVAEGYRRDRAVDESGNQIGITNRVGSRPFNARDLARLLKRRGEPIVVENSTPRRPR